MKAREIYAFDLLFRFFQIEALCQQKILDVPYIYDKTIKLYVFIVCDEPYSI